MKGGTTSEVAIRGQWMAGRAMSMMGHEGDYPLMTRTSGYQQNMVNNQFRDASEGLKKVFNYTFSAGFTPAPWLRPERQQHGLEFSPSARPA